MVQLLINPGDGLDRYRLHADPVLIGKYESKKECEHALMDYALERFDGAKIESGERGATASAGFGNYKKYLECVFVDNP